MSTIRFPHPRRVLLAHEPWYNRHIIWTQEFSDSRRSWSSPQLHDDASSAIFSNTQYRGMAPSEVITKWAFSHPIVKHFTSVTHLTISNHDNFAMRDILKMLDSVPQLEDLELCRVNITIPDTDRYNTQPLTPPANMRRELKRLALEACNITEGYADAEYNLLFRFLALFEHINRLRLVATIFRGEDAGFEPSLPATLPTLVHLEVEGFFSYVLRAFFLDGKSVVGLRSLHLSRCLSSWGKLYRLKTIVQIVSPTLQHLSFRPNLEANTQSGSCGLNALFREFAEAVAGCTELQELEFGLYTSDDRDRWLGMSLFREILKALPPARLDHLALVLDLGDAQVSPSDVVPWASLDAQMNRVCSSAFNLWPLEVRIERRPGRNMPAGFYAEQRFWVRLLPEMRGRMREVADGVRGESLAVGRYVAPMAIDVLRAARITGSGLRSLFDQ